MLRLLPTLLFFVIIQACSNGNAQTLVRYNDDGNFQTSAYSESGVRVTSSNILNFTEGGFSGIGVVGGVDTLVGPGEFVLFFAEGSAQFTSFDINPPVQGDTNNDGRLDDFRAEAFDESGTSLGVFTAYGNGNLGSFDYVSLFGVSEVKYFQFASTGDSFNVGSIEVTLEGGGGGVTLPPASFTVTNGQYISGGVAELSESDNLDLVGRRSNTDIQSRVVVEFTTTSPDLNPDSLSYTLESSVFARTNVIQTMELFDYFVNDFEAIDSRDASRFSDAVVTADAKGDLSRFVNPFTQEIRARVRYNSTNPRQQFSAGIDQAIWTIE